MRKAAHESVHKSQDFYENQTTEALLLARGGLQDALGWNKHVRRAVASMTTSCIYNKPTITSEQDGRIGYIQGFAARATSAAAPGAHWAVEKLPWMRYIPSRWAPWKRTAKEWHRKDSEIFLQLYGQVRDKVIVGDEQASICATLIRNADRHGLSDLESAWTAAALYAAGSDPVFAVMLFWSLAMLVYPDTQERAQQELDTVVGRARVPTFADMPHLPYIRAMVKEANRWASALPLAVTQDNFYGDYFIPKGTIVVANTWELNRDPEVYGSDVHCFNPARFLDEQGKVISGPPGSKGEGHFTFGFGKRICVGRTIADNSLFINIATCLWAFSMTNVEGQKLNVGESDDDGLTIRPKPFDVEIQPRFPEAVTLLSHECELRGQ
ncbi:cytochrome P450, partial [Peniophora sp. CONT]